MRTILVLVTAVFLLSSGAGQERPALMVAACVNAHAGAAVEVRAPAERIFALIERLEAAGFSCTPPRPFPKALPTV